MVAEKLDADLIARNAINRSVLVVRAAEPFNRWAARLDRSRVRRPPPTCDDARCSLKGKS